MTDSKGKKAKKASTVLVFAPEKPGTFKLYFIQFVAIFVIGIILWPVLDIIYSAVLTHAPFVYTADQYILQPFIFAVIFAILSYLIDLIRFKTRKSKK